MVSMNNLCKSSTTERKRKLGSLLKEGVESKGFFGCLRYILTHMLIPWKEKGKKKKKTPINREKGNSFRWNICELQQGSWP